MDVTNIQLLTVAMAITRISVFFLVCPVFSWRGIPNQVKIVIILFMSIFFSMSAPAQLGTGKVTVLETILLMSNEAIYGFALGLISVLIFSAVKIAGRIIETQMGLSMAATLDPLTGETSNPLSMLLEMLFILLFLSAGGHHMLLMIISKSYEAFPACGIPDISVLLDGVVQAGSTMLIVALRLAGPMLAAFLLLLTVLAVLARIMPDMNILFISMPLRVGLGLLMAGMFFPFISQFVGEFSEWMGKLLPL